ncbi:MAG: beta-lactamase family protein [Actinomycetia bacterium]|nr:beta-lactamase family protein [Actinomycetes bacterium]
MADGHCDPRFSLVEMIFDEPFEAGTERGGSVAVVHDGELVVDLWAGDADGELRPWTAETIVGLWSTTKTFTFLSILVLADRGLLGLDDKVADHWPQFAANGKEAVTIGQVLSHTSGLSGFDRRVSVVDLYDWDAVVSGLAAQPPWWEPGSRSGYHPVTQGFLLGEIVRRVDGRTVDQFFRDEIAGPAGANCHIRLDDPARPEIGDLVPPPEVVDVTGLDPHSVAGRTVANPRFTGAEPATAEWRRALLPAAGGFGNARSVAQVLSPLALSGGSLDGHQLISDATVGAAQQVRSDGVDLILEEHIRFGAGFSLPSPDAPFSPNPEALSWGGWGGSLVVIDPDQALLVAYVPNRMAPGGSEDSRGQSLVDVAYASVL